MQSKSRAEIERRSHPRLQLPLPARFLTPDGEEVECLTVDISASGIRFRTARPPQIGATVIAYVKELGRLQGVAVRRLDDGFAMELITTALKMQRLAEKIAQLSGAPERRLFERLEVHGAQIVLRIGTDPEMRVEIIDVSTTGVAFRGDFTLKPGDRVEVGGRAAVVARMFQGGAAASFL